MPRSLIILLTLITLTLPTTLPAQDTPIDEAKRAGLYGITPDLDRQVGSEQTALGQAVAWEDYGVFLQEHDGRAFIAALDPQSPAVQLGVQVGDVLHSNMVTIYSGFASKADMDEQFRSVNLRIQDRQTGGIEMVPVVPFERDTDGFEIPAPLRQAATANSGLMAILRKDPTSADPVEVAVDAMLALQAISEHFNNCAGPAAVDIPVNVTVTTTTRDGLGTYRGTETDQYSEVLRVRPEFARWARANIRLYPTQAVSTVRSAVVDLLTVEGCNGRGVRQLEAGLAALMGLELAETAEPQTTSAALPAGNDAFISQCYPAYFQYLINQGSGLIGERSVASICLCQEHAARLVGDLALYESLQIADYRYWESNPDIHEGFNAAFDACFRAPDGSELRNQIEALWQRMQI